MTPELVIAGNLLVDDLVFDSGQTRMGEAGGAVVHAALAASLWGLRVGCVSWRGEDYPEGVLQALADRGIDLAGVHALGRPGGRTWLLYEERGRRMVPRQGRPTHDEVSPRPADFPPGWERARACHLAPMPMAVHRTFVEELSPQPGTLLALDPHQAITEETLAEWQEVLAQVDVVFPGEDEMQLAGTAEAPGAVLRRLAVGRLRYVIFKRGARGGLLYDARKDRIIEWQARTAGVVDPTGAGDAFAAGFLTGLLAGLPAEESLRRGIVSASFALADWGARGLLAAGHEVARQRLRAWYGELTP
jgi:sugar/nucleoside kinase (ribokinase family)